MAMKKAEDSSEVIVRIVEVDGRGVQEAKLAFAAPVVRAREVNGQEQPQQPLRAAPVDNGQLVTSLTPYQIRTFAVTLAEPAVKAMAPKWRSVALPHDVDVASTDGAKNAGAFDFGGRSLPAEMLPRTIEYQGIEFELASHAGPNAIVARGQVLPLHSGARRVYVLAAADVDQAAAMLIGDQAVGAKIQDWSEFIGQWDTRRWERREEDLPPRPDAPPNAPPRRTRASEVVTGLNPAFIKPAPVAWFASHRHTPEGANEPYAYSYLFAYAFEVPKGAATLTLPDNPQIRVLAVTTSDQSAPIEPLQPLYDRLTR
jgi:alpha-mannosidase